MDGVRDEGWVRSVVQCIGADRAGGRVDARLANADLGQPGSRWPIALTGGRWAMGRGPSRALEPLRKFLRKQGFRAVSSELRKERARRAK